MPTSLISIVSAMALVGILALLAAPSFNAVTLDRNRAAVQELQYLVSLARERSASTGLFHGVRWDRDRASLEVIRADFTQSPPVVVETIHDPVTKQPARFTLPGGMALSPDAPFTFSTIGATDTLYFDAWGTPVNRQTGNHLQLTTGRMIVRAENWQGLVEIYPVSGRVVTSG